MRALCCLVTTLLLLALPIQGTADDSLMEEVRAIGDTMSKAMVAGDTEAKLSLYAEDAISLPNYSPRMEGAEALRDYHDGMAGHGVKIHSFSTAPIQVWEAGDQVIEVGSFKINFDMPGVTGFEDVGKYVNIYVRDADGKLKIKVETWNTDVNPMEATMAMQGGQLLEERKTVQIHYLEIVTKEVDAVCAAYAEANGVQFGEPDAGLGNARTAALHGGGLVGVRAPLRETEEPVVRPYLLVDNIEAALTAAVEAGGEVAHPPLEIPGHGTFAIYIHGGIQHGLWQL